MKTVRIHDNGGPGALESLAAMADSVAVKPRVSTVAPLAEAASAHDPSQTGNVRGKIVLGVR